MEADNMTAIAILVVSVEADNMEAKPLQVASVRSDNMALSLFRLGVEIIS